MLVGQAWYKQTFEQTFVQTYEQTFEQTFEQIFKQTFEQTHESRNGSGSSKLTYLNLNWVADKGGDFRAGVPDFLVQYTKTVKIYQISSRYTNWPQNISNGRQIDQVSTKYTNILHCRALFKEVARGGERTRVHCKTLQNLPKLEFLVWKCTIWQPCFGVAPVLKLNKQLLVKITSRGFPEFWKLLTSMSDFNQFSFLFILVFATGCFRYFIFRYFWDQCHWI
jgi:hypothetical protein